jgi:hypothetical protein
MGAGYILSGMDKGIQYGLSHKMSQMSMSLMQRQQKFAEDQLNDPVAQKKRQLEVEVLQQKVNKENKIIDAIAGQGDGLTAGGIMTEFKSYQDNVSQLLAGGDTTQKYIDGYAKFSKSAGAIKVDGSSMLSSSQQTQIANFDNNKYSKAYVQLANTMKSTGKIGDLKDMFDYISTPAGRKAFMKKTGITEEGMNNIVTAFDPKGVMTNEMLDNEIDLKSRTDAIDMDNANMSDLDGIITDATSMYDGGKLSRSAFKTISTKLIPETMKMDYADKGVVPGTNKGHLLWKKEYSSSAEIALSYIDSVIPRNTETQAGWKERYDLRSRIAQKLSEGGYEYNGQVSPGGIKLGDTSSASRMETKYVANLVSAEYMTEKYPSLAKGRDMTDPAERDFVVAKAENTIANNKAINYSNNVNPLGKKKSTTTGKQTVISEAGGGFTLDRSLKRTNKLVEEYKGKTGSDFNSEEVEKLKDLNPFSAKAQLLNQIIDTQKAEQRIRDINLGIKNKEDATLKREEATLKRQLADYEKKWGKAYDAEAEEKSYDWAYGKPVKSRSIRMTMKRLERIRSKS